MRTSVTAIVIGLVSVAVGSSQGTEPPDPPSSQQADLSPTERTASTLSLGQALSRAVNQNPRLAAESLRLSAAKARINQAGLFPNPEVEIEAENFGGDGDLSGYNAAETTAVISQPIPLGPRRGRARSLAEADHLLASRDLDANRLDVVAGVTSAFYRLVAAQEREELSRRMVDLAVQFETTVRARVDAGKVSPVEATRAAIEVGKAQAQAARAAHEREAARTLLASWWGSSTSDFELANGALPRPVDPPRFEEVRFSLNQTPEIVRLDDQIERAKRAADLEKSVRVPDLRVSVGPRRFEDTGESAWVAGLSVPIPVFDRNQGSRKAADFEAKRARRDADAARVTREAELAAVLDRLRATAEEARIIEDDVVPAANHAFVATETGYSAGKFGFLNVLDAQRALFDAHSLLLDRREEYALVLTVIERLIGRELDGVRLDRPATTTNTWESDNETH
jgi:cobalt-zinc-cadmium efflux system outer membrane protein